MYTGKSKELIAFLKSQLKNEFAEIKDLQNKEAVYNLNAKRSNFLIQSVAERRFIQDDSLENYANRVMRTIISANSLVYEGRRVLLSKSPYVNAYCYGQGIYIVTVSLLGRISTEDQLAFTLAHEIAHDELGHIKLKIMQEAEINLLERSKEQVKKIVSGTIEIEDIEEFRKLI